MVLFEHERRIVIIFESATKKNEWMNEWINKWMNEWMNERWERKDSRNDKIIQGWTRRQETSHL
jgi:hypothetical protein